MLMFVTAVSLALAIAMSVVAWQLARRERRRSEARVAALAMAIGRDPLADLPIYRAESIAQRPALLPTRDAAEAMFAASAHSGRSHGAAALAAGVLVVGSAAALAVVLSGSPAWTRVAARQASPAGKIGSAEPIELVSLGHERDGGALAVHGTIRNPRGGQEIDGLNAVVFLFHRDGSFAASTHTAVAPAVLAPGGEASFRLVIPTADDVARYRVSFRTDQRVVAHVDRRGAARGERP